MNEEMFEKIAEEAYIDEMEKISISLKGIGKAIGKTLKGSKKLSRVPVSPPPGVIRRRSAIKLPSIQMPIRNTMFT